MLDDAVGNPLVPRVPVEFPNELEQEIDILAKGPISSP
jgi:hypothetical protein